VFQKLFDIGFRKVLHIIRLIVNWCAITIGCLNYDREAVGSTPGRVTIKWLYLNGSLSAERQTISIYRPNQHQCQLSLLSLRDNRPLWQRLRWDMFTCVGRWQVIVWYHMAGDAPYLCDSEGFPIKRLQFIFYI